MTAKLYVHQLIPQVGCEGVGCDDCKYQFFNVPFTACALEHGMSIFGLAGRLWDLAGVPKPEIARLSREILDARGPRGGGHLVSREQIDRMLASIDGLDAKLTQQFGPLPEPATDPRRPDRERNPELYGELVLDPDRSIAIATAYARVVELRDYLRFAVKLGRELLHAAA